MTRESIVDGVVTHPLSEQRANQLYVRLDGSNKPKLIDIDGGAGLYDRIKTKMGQIKSHPTLDYFYFKNRADTAYARVYMGVTHTAFFQPLVDSLVFRTSNVDFRHLWQGYLAGHLDLMEIKNQYVYLWNLPVADPSELGALWNDGGVIKISSG